MQEPTRSEADLNLIGDELERLFAVQDKNLSEKKKAILVHELMETEFPIQAILNGIKSLLDTDLKSVKLGIIIMASRQFIEQETEPQSKCPDCIDGFVLMKDDEGRVCSMGCQCAKGRGRAKENQIIRWEGQGDQFVKRGLLAKMAIPKMLINGWYDGKSI